MVHPLNRHRVSEAATVVRTLFSHPEVQNGADYEGLDVSVKAPAADDPRNLERLWKLSARLTGLGD
ncbi:hypothetical protein GCM10012275_44230 [Longimycelium tulufanense]|uniref:Uncharacterized protein n=2 Tax=Longimycelium tulufanense TaxID=907463 RepID=A0A8J3FY53_9PSEU|nr:hypothetical protein GCM10012275_44230 [Longimycelium tulufanense]